MKGARLRPQITPPFLTGTVIGKGTGNLQRTQNRLKPSAMSTAERNLADGFQNIRTYETMFSLPRLVVNTSRDLMAEYEKKKDKTMHGARSDAFALAVVFLAMSMHSTGKTLKEIAAVSKVDEKDIRSHIKRIQKTIPTALAKTTSPEDFIRVIINDIEAPFLLERLACEIISRALNHACIEGACVKEYLEGKRNSTLAAGAVLVAARKGGIPNIKEADVAAGAMIAEGTAIQSCRLIEGHWDAMFVDRSFGDIYEEMKALEERTRAHLATAAADATPRVKI